MPLLTNRSGGHEIRYRPTLGSIYSRMESKWYNGTADTHESRDFRQAKCTQTLTGAERNRPFAASDRHSVRFLPFRGVPPNSLCRTSDAPYAPAPGGVEPVKCRT